MSDYRDFIGRIAKRADIRAIVEADSGIASRRQQLSAAFDTWWSLARNGLVALPQSKRLMPLRRDLLDSFEPAILPVSCLDRYALMGSIAGWWDEIRYELRVIVENGFAELVDGWVETLRSALEDDDADDDEDSDTKKSVKVTLEELLSHPFVRHRMADYVTELSAAQAEVERIKAEKEAWETGDGVEGAEDWLDGAEEGATLPKVLEKRRKELRAEMGEDDRRSKELAKTTPAGKPSKGSGMPDPAKLSDFAFINPATDTNSAQADAPVAFIPMAAVAEGGGWGSTENRPLSDGRKGYTLFQRGDVIVAKITPCFENGKVALLSDLDTALGLGSTEFHVLRAKPGHDPRFIYHWTRHPALLRAGEASMTGSAGQRRVPAGFFERFEITRIEGPPQRMIADILDAIDDAILETDAVIEKLRTIHVGIIDDLLTRGLADDGSPRDQSALIETAVGPGPARWTVANLGRFVIGAEYGTNLSLGDSSAGIPVLRMNNIQDGEFDLSDLKYAPARAVERFRVQRNDVLFNRTNSWEHVGKAAIWRRDEHGPAFASYLVRLHCGEALLPEFLHLWLNWAPVQRAIRQFATPGVQQVNINPTNLRRALIAVPDSLDEQRAIIERVNGVAAAIGDHRHQRAKLSSLREGLRGDLLTGRKPVVTIKEAAE